MYEDETEQANESEQENEADDPEVTPERAEYLEEVPDGAGCTEIWDHLSERRECDGD